MLNITKHSENGKAVMTIEGEINTLSAKELEAALEGFLDGVVDMTIDMKGVPYITSAGLRILLEMEQTMEEQMEEKYVTKADFNALMQKLDGLLN